MPKSSQSSEQAALKQVARLGAKVGKVLVGRARDFAKEASDQFSDTLRQAIREAEDDLNESTSPPEGDCNDKGP
jgi:CHASE3 domain sensor protein